MYFEPTTADIKAAQKSLHARTEALVNAPFRTREMKEAAEKAKAEKYPTVNSLQPAQQSSSHDSFKATIRVKFSDRTQLERVFPSDNKIKSVYAFVRSLLREDVKPIKFVLCAWNRPFLPRWISMCTPPV